LGHPPTLLARDFDVALVLLISPLILAVGSVMNRKDVQSLRVAAELNDKGH
jgi:hypothetical protein